MATRKPTPNQLEGLEDVAAGSSPSTPVLRNLITRGWVRLGAWDKPELTADGQEAVDDARTVRDYEAIPYDQRPRVSVERRRLGRSPIRGGGKIHDGRNVTCSLCYQERKRAHDAGETRIGPDRVVWFTNEGGRPAQARAELAMMRHALKHYREPRED